MEEGLVNLGRGKGKKRGRKRKNKNGFMQNIMGQSKFFVDLSKDLQALEMIREKIKLVNDKDEGRDLSFKDLAIYGIKKLSAKDLEKIKEEGLSKMEKVERLLKEYNQKNNSSLDMADFLIHKLNIN